MVEPFVAATLAAEHAPARPERIAELERARVSAAWDQEPMAGLTRRDLDEEAIERWTKSVGERWTDAKPRSLGVLGSLGGALVPTRAGIILFGGDRELHFPDAQIRCARFRGSDKSHPLAAGPEGGPGSHEKTSNPA